MHFTGFMLARFAGFEFIASSGESVGDLTVLVFLA
jgi:hypothetical protein